MNSENTVSNIIVTAITVFSDTSWWPDRLTSVITTPTPFTSDPPHLTCSQGSCQQNHQQHVYKQNWTAPGFIEKLCFKVAWEHSYSVHYFFKREERGTEQLCAGKNQKWVREAPLRNLLLVSWSERTDSQVMLTAHSRSTDREGTGRAVINKNQPSLPSSCPEEEVMWGCMLIPNSTQAGSTFRAKGLPLSRLHCGSPLLFKMKRTGFILIINVTAGYF